MSTETPERWHRIAALFDAAVKLPPEGRDEYLREACGYDADLRRRVTDLLEASGQIADFLERPVVSRPADLLRQMAGAPKAGASPSADHRLPSTDDPRPSSATESLIEGGTVSRLLGPYLLIQKLGEGGMGEVYLAEQQEPIRRKVALKVIKAGLGSKQVIARFEAERQALALMDHPAIAKVFDAGETADHHPYFVMEYVPGVPISEHCDLQSLTTRERLELFLQVCDGVQHAHQKAVIHRDLKPSNVLVSFQDGRATVRIIDFGVAKAVAQRLTERTLFTELGMMIGTPEYMSPEQAEMTGQDVDTRSDVYSLGVMLYELLVGALPFESKDLREAGYDEIRRKIREEEPPRPSARLSAMGDRSTESARRRRTEPKALRRELRGDLDWITMRALEKDRSRRYGSAAELAQEIRRYLSDEPVLAHAPSAGYRTRKFVRRHRVGVVAALVVVAALAAGVIASTVEMVRARRAEAQARQEAQAKGQVVDFLKDLFKVSDPSEARSNSVTARELLDQGVTRLQTGLKEEPRVRADLMETMGGVYDSLGLYKQAELLLKDVVETGQRSLGSEDPLTLHAMASLAITWINLGRDKEAEQSLMATIQAQKRVLGPEHSDTLRSMNNLALSYSHQGREKEAEALNQEVLEIRKRVLGPEHPDTMRSMNNLAISYSGQGRIKEAEVLYREVVKISKHLLGPEHPDTLRSMNNLAICYSDQGLDKEAEGLHREVLEIRKRVLGPEHPDTLTSMNNLALSYSGQGRNKEAEVLYREVLEIRKRVLGREHPDTLWTMSDLASAYGGQGRYKEAEVLDREVLEIRKRVLGPEHFLTLKVMNNLARSYSGQGRYEEAEVMDREVLETSKRVVGPENPDTLTYMCSLGTDLLNLDRPIRATRELFGALLETQSRILGPEHPSTLQTMYNLARAMLRDGDLIDMEPLALKNLEIRRRVLGPEHPDTLCSMDSMAFLLAAKGQTEKAESLFREVYQMRAKVLGPSHPDTIHVDYDMGVAAVRQGRTAAALAHLRDAVDHGYDKVPEIETSKEFASFHGEPAFEAIVAKARKNKEAAAKH